MKKNIAVITGGEAAELGISLLSAEVVCKNLNKEKYNVYKIIIEANGWLVEGAEVDKLYIDLNDFSCPLPTGKINFDCVFVAIHGTPAEDGKLQGYFDMLKIPYNCCGVLQAALTFDKFRCKEYLSMFGIKSSRALLLKRDIDTEAPDTDFPVFVKPNKNGSSYGASKVSTAEKLLPALQSAFKYDDEVLVEDYLAGIELTCGVITYKGNVTALPLTEIRSKSEFFDYKAKYEGNSNEITPAEIEPEIAKRVQETSEFIYRKLDMKGFCRIDYILVGDDYFMLEVNSIPGLSPGSIVPQQARKMGITLEELFGNSIEEALKPAR